MMPLFFLVCDMLLNHDKRVRNDLFGHREGDAVYSPMPLGFNGVPCESRVHLFIFRFPTASNGPFEVARGWEEVATPA